MARGAVLLGPKNITRNPQTQPSTTDPITQWRASHPLVWRYHSPPNIAAYLVTFKNLRVTITNLELELSVSILHHECAAHCFDVRWHTTNSKTDNTPTLFGNKRGLPPPHMIRCICNAFRLFTSGTTARSHDTTCPPKFESDIWSTLAIHSPRQRHSPSTLQWHLPAESTLATVESFATDDSRNRFS